MVESDISFDHLKPELVAKVKEFTEKLEDVELKEVEVSGWREMRREIPIDRELAERWGSPPRQPGDLDLNDVLASNLAPLSQPKRRVKVSIMKTIYVVVCCVDVSCNVM